MRQTTVSNILIIDTSKDTEVKGYEVSLRNGLVFKSKKAACKFEAELNKLIKIKGKGII